MAYAWTKELETGNSAIDKQHYDLIDAINHLLEACSKGKGRSEIGKTLKFLNDYITHHFADEEVLQKKYGYPDFVNHKKYHEDFKKSISDIQKEFDNGGATIALVAKVNSVIAAWLINHIKRQDIKVAAHVRAKSI